MNRTIDTDGVTTNTTTLAATTAPRRPATKRQAPAVPVVDAGAGTQELLGKRPASEVTRLVFMALLGCAACIALVGVVGEANDPGTSPDDPPPAVIGDRGN